MEKNKELLNLIINNQIKEITDIILKEYVIIDNNIILEDVSYLTSWIPSAGDSYDYFVSLFSFTNDPAFWGLTLAGLGAIADVFSSLYAEFPILSTGLGLLAGIFYYKAGLKYIESGNIVGGDVGNQRWLIGVILCSIAIVLMIANACGFAYRFKSILSIQKVQNAMEGMEIAGKTRNVAVKAGINKFNNNTEVKKTAFRIDVKEVTNSPVEEIIVTTKIEVDNTIIKGDIDGNFKCKGKIEKRADGYMLILDENLPEVTFHISEIATVQNTAGAIKEINYKALQKAYNDDYAKGFAESLSLQADSDLESVIGDLVAMEGFIGEIDENLKTITGSQLENELTKIVIFDNGRPIGLNKVGKQKLADLNAQLKMKNLKQWEEAEYIEFLYNSKNEGNKKLLEDASEKISEAIEVRNNAGGSPKEVSSNVSLNASEQSVKSTGGITTWKIWKTLSKKKETNTNTKYSPAYNNGVLNSFLISFNSLSSKLKNTLNRKPLDLPVLIRIRYHDGRFAGATHEIQATLNVESIVPNGAMIARAKVKVSEKDLIEESAKMNEAFDILSKPNTTNNIVPFDMYGHMNHTQGEKILVTFQATQKKEGGWKLTYTATDPITGNTGKPVKIDVTDPAATAINMNEQISKYNNAITNMENIQSKMSVKQMSSQHPFVINGNNYNPTTKKWLADNLYNEPSLASDYNTVVFSMRQPVEKNVDNSANALNVYKDTNVSKIRKAFEWCAKKSINFREAASNATDTVLKAGTNAKTAINNNRSTLTVTEFVLWMYTKTLVGADDEGGFTLFDFEWGDDLYDTTKPMTIDSTNGDKIILTVEPIEEATKELNKIDNTDPF